MCKVEMACVLYDHTSQGARDFSRKTGEWTHWLQLAVCQATPSSPLRYAKRACGESLLRTHEIAVMRYWWGNFAWNWRYYEPGGRQPCLQRCEVLVALRNQVSIEYNGIIVISNHVQCYNMLQQYNIDFAKSVALWILILFMLSVLSPGIPVDNAGFEIAGHIAPPGQLSSSSWSWIHPSMVLASADCECCREQIWIIIFLKVANGHFSRRWSQARCAWAPLRTRRPSWTLSW